MTTFMTTDCPLAVCTAAVGTVKASAISRTVIDTLADPPAYNPAGDPVTAMVTGNVVTPPDVVATTPTVETVPKIGVRLPDGRIVACRPCLSDGKSPEDTDVVTVHESVVMTTICAVVAPADPDEPEPLPPDPPDPPDDVPLPATWSPTDIDTDATVPAIGDTRVVLVRLACALASLALAEASCEFAAASCAAVVVEELLAVVSEALAAFTLAAARLTAILAFAGSMVATCWLADTLSPTLTATLVTVPEVANRKFDCTAGVIVPVALIDWLSVCTLAATVVWVAAVVVVLLRWFHHQRPPPPTRTITTAMATLRRARVFLTP